MKGQKWKWTHDSLKLVRFVGVMENEVNGVEILETKLEEEITSHYANPEKNQFDVDDETGKNQIKEISIQ